jgi:carbon-monoxide dehydrogenase large subunit
VFTGSHSHGQGHETTFSQVVASRLGIPIENVEIVHGDTGRIPFGMGTYGSRSLAVGGTAIVKALDKIVAKGKKIAAHMLEAAESDIEFKDGKFTVAGTDRNKTFGEVALAPRCRTLYPWTKQGRARRPRSHPPISPFPPGRICEVEIDPETASCKSSISVPATIWQHHQSDDRRRPGARRRRASAGAARELRLRQAKRPVADRQLWITRCHADDLPSFKVSTKVAVHHNPSAPRVRQAGAVGARRP